MEETSEGHMDQPFSQGSLDQLLRAFFGILNTSKDRGLTASLCLVPVFDYLMVKIKN